jgi:hypothetical protein
LVGRFLLITHSIVYFAIMTQTFSSFSEFSSGLGPTFMSGAATSCHSQALAYRGQVFETHGDCQADCQPTSDRSTRGNSPRTGDSRTKLKLRSKPVDPRALGLRAALEATASDQQAATEGVQTPADKENDTNLDNAWPRVSVRDLAPGLNKPRSLKPSSEAFQGDCEVKYKTELCRNFELTGRCKYGPKCSYAHGRDELVNEEAHQPALQEQEMQQVLRERLLRVWLQMPVPSQRGLLHPHSGLLLREAARLDRAKPSIGHEFDHEEDPHVRKSQ